jgi:hypothetical protein
MKSHLCALTFDQLYQPPLGSLFHPLGSLFQVGFLVGCRREMFDVSMIWFIGALAADKRMQMNEEPLACAYL